MITKDELQKIKEELIKLVPKFAYDIAPIYRLLLWRWYINGDNYIVPLEANIVAKCYRMINELSEEISEIFTGGIKIGYENNDDRQTELIMEFVYSVGEVI